MEFVVLVDDQDNPIGKMEKQQAHIEGLLHRAFPFLFSTPRKNYCFKNVLLLNIIVVVYGQTLAAHTQEKTKTFKTLPIGDLLKKWECNAL